MILYPMMPVLSFKHMEINSTQQKKKPLFMAAAIPMLDLWDADSAHQLSSSLSCRLEAPRGPWAGISRSGPLQGLPALPCPALPLLPLGSRITRDGAGLGGTRRSSLAAAQSCGFSAACAGGTTFLAGDARGAPGRGSACVCTQLCSSLRPSECLGWVRSQPGAAQPRAPGDV